MPKPIKPLGDAWPWPAASDDRESWHETNEERWWYALEVLPPIYFEGGFFMGEPAIHDRRGVPVHAAFVKMAGRYFVREIPTDKHAEALKELRESLAGGGP